MFRAGAHWSYQVIESAEMWQKSAENWWENGTTLQPDFSTKVFDKETGSIPWAHNITRQPFQAFVYIKPGADLLYLH
jgi:hypothetical protein